MKYEVYRITNTVNNKKYIGITTQGILDRFRKHQVEANNGSERYLCKAFRKYGIESFKIEFLDNAESYEELLKKEIYYIGKEDTLAPNGYNMTLGGEGALGRKHTVEAKQKISEKRKGFKYSDEEKERIRQKSLEISYWKGKKLPEETRKKISESKKGKKLSEETKEKRKYIYENMKGENHPLWGVGHTEASKKKMSESKKGTGVVGYRAYNDKEEIIFKSLKDAVSFLGIKSHSALIKSSRDKTIYRGYYWERLKQDNHEPRR